MGGLLHEGTRVPHPVRIHIEDELPGHPLDESAHLIAQHLLLSGQNRIQHAL